MGIKRNQKRVVQKDGTITKEEMKAEKINAAQLLDKAKKLHKPAYFLRKDTHAGTVTKIYIGLG